MSHFYGRLKGSRGEATRCGTKASGYTTHAGSWEGGVRVHLWWNEHEQKNWARISLMVWQGRGINRLLYEGPVDGQPLSALTEAVLGDS